MHRVAPAFARHVTFSARVVLGTLLVVFGGDAAEAQVRQVALGAAAGAHLEEIPRTSCTAAMVSASGLALFRGRAIDPCDKQVEHCDPEARAAPAHQHSERHVVR